MSTNDPEACAPRPSQPRRSKAQAQVELGLEELQGDSFMALLDQIGSEPFVGGPEPGAQASAVTPEEIAAPINAGIVRARRGDA